MDDDSGIVQKNGFTGRFERNIFLSGSYGQRLVQYLCGKLIFVLHIKIERKCPRAERSLTYNLRSKMVV